ncbi:hypothetical protein GCM10011391_24560 [Pullulanibacillus camelliae]|uniref:Nucleotidyltransferase n=1 Tax=Pullulanibacillus camelliae TaxID=1707096 RepID=A0A8J2YIN4_9BACL|nr:DUF294 nucleotidyltransferase-like domain-containing protein [Pullulanibacillus camelliae]GGE44820.1 hypothetical protein GCM10011391_24560 [Pullulanibacillus camelliae]
MNNAFTRLAKQIERTENLQGLRSCHQHIFSALQEMYFSQQTIVQMLDHVNRIHDALMKKAISIAEQETLASGIGTAPPHFCVYLLGSGARFEQTIWTDQDNGILYCCESEDSYHCRSFIGDLAKRMTNALHTIGYPYCPGNVMATNPRWSKAFKDWLASMQAHIQASQPDDIRYLYIASDLRPIYGSTQLIYHAQTQLNQAIKASKHAIKRMQEHLEQPKVPLGLFGQVHKERWGEHSGEINIKTSLYVPIVNSVKFLAIQHEIQATTTLERLDMLKNKGFISERVSIEIKKAFTSSLYFRLHSSLGQEENNNYLRLNRLSSQDKAVLKAAMRTARHWQKHVLNWNGVKSYE